MSKDIKIRKTSIYGIIGNIFLLIIKGFIGILFQSQAMIADAANSASDIFASIMSFIGNKISLEPADDDHNLGHGKAEYIFSLFIGIVMIVVSLLLIGESLNKLINNFEFKFSMLLIIICLITIVTKLSLYIYTKKIYNQTKNILIKTLYIDHRNDCFITFSTMIGIIFSYYNVYWIDSVIGIIISFWIIYTGSKVVIESYEVLMDQSIDNESKLKIEEVIYNFSNNIKMGKMSSIPIGYKYIIVLTIYVDGMMPTYEAHNITKELQRQIKRKVKKIDRVIIHVNPNKN